MNAVASGRAGTSRSRVLATLCVCALAGCRTHPATNTAPLVVVSVLPQVFAVERIAGDLVRVEVMIPPGASPATYEPTLSKLKSVADANLYVKVGHPHFPFERAWLGRLLGERDDLLVVDASQDVEADEHDPHVWVSPRHMRTMARNVHGALLRLLPDERAALDAGLAGLLEDIDAVDAEVRGLLAASEGRRFFVFHPAWSYFADDYGLVQVAIEEHGKEPDAKSLAALIADAKRAGVRVIFVQPQFDPASARLIADEIGARVETLDPLVPLWDENLRRVARLLATGTVE